MATAKPKHESGTTLGDHPELYPYVMEHINDTDVERNLRSEIAKNEWAVMMGAPDEAAFLSWLLLLTNARKVIEVGVFRGSTTLRLAMGLPKDGKVVGLDVSDEYAQLGKEAWKAAGVDHKVDFRLGKAVDILAQMAADKTEVGTYDMVFIDADKVNYGAYYEAALVMLRPGGVIAVDNCLWGGKVVDQEKISKDEDTNAIATLNEKIRSDSRVHAVMLPVADGLYLARKV